MLAIARGHHAWRYGTCLDVVGRRWYWAGVGDFPRMGDLVVMSRGFVGVYRGFAVSAVFSRRRFQGRFSRTADFQRSRWDNIRKAAGFPRTPTSDTGEQAQTGKSRQFSRIIHTPPPQSQSPPASADTDSRPSVSRRLHRHRQLPQRRQTLLPTPTAIPTSPDTSTDTDSRLNVDKRF